LALLQPIPKIALVSLSIGKEVPAFPMELVFLPVSKIDIVVGVVVDALAFFALSF
jgi:hypothetical protein